MRILRLGFVIITYVIFNNILYIYLLILKVKNNLIILIIYFILIKLILIYFYFILINIIN